MKLKHKITLSIFVIIATIILLWAAADQWQAYKAKPQLNPHPKYFVTLTGNIEKHMPYPMTIMYKATYAAYAPTCGEWISRLEGVQGLAAKNFYYPVKVNQQGNYTVRIPIDKYIPGKCNWKMAWVMLAYVNHLPPRKDWPYTPTWGDMIRFGKEGNPNELPGQPFKNKGNAYCGKKGSDYCTGDQLAGWYSKYVPREKNYNYVLNMKSKRNQHDRT